MSAPTARRVTPTAVRVLPADADKDTWLAERRKGIGSSDVPAILGVADRRTPVHVYHDKRGELVDDAGEYALWGNLLEDPVAREWARRNRSVIQRVGLVAHVDTPWALATLDRRVAECPLNRQVRQACALEVKLRNAFVSHRWRGDVPDDVLAQTAWQMRVTGYDHVHVAVLIGGNDYRQTVIRHDDGVAAFIDREVTSFRDEHLIAGVEPVWDLDKAKALIEMDTLMHPERAGTRELTLDELGEVMAYASASAAAGVADRRKKRARAVLARIAAGRQVLTFENELAFKFGPVSKRVVDLDRLAEQWPTAYADCVTDKDHYAIRIASAYRQTGDDTDE